MDNKNRDTQLQELDHKFSLLGKAISLKYGSMSVSGTLMMDKVLLIIGSEKTVNIKRLSSIMLVTSGAATQHVTTLEEAGAVKRTMGPQDRREIEVHLTAKGQRMYEKVKDNFLRVLREIFADLDRSELATLVQLMTKVSNKYQSEGERNDH